jgi:hypothetical protein
MEPRSGSRNEANTGELLLTEYRAIKDEQRARIGFRDNLLYVTLAAVAAIVVATAQSRQRSMLLALPPVCVVLGWTYLMNDEKISAIGAYVRSRLGPRLAVLAGGESIFGWEHEHRGGIRRKSRKVVQCIVDIGAFCVVPLAALTVFWADWQRDDLLLTLSIIEGLTVLGLGSQIILYALPTRKAQNSGTGTGQVEL